LSIIKKRIIHGAAFLMIIGEILYKKDIIHKKSYNNLTLIFCRILIMWVSGSGQFIKAAYSLFGWNHPWGKTRESTSWIRVDSTL